MFTPARVVVLDDDPAHLGAIRTAIEALGSSCVCLTYSEEKDPPEAPFARARVIFMDLQLRNRQTNFNLHYAEIQRILGKVIPPDGGPFLLIVWTDRPEQIQDLEAYLEKNLYPRHPHTRPVQLVSMSKADFIVLETGEARDPEALREHVGRQLEVVPALAALLRWETDIIAASDRVVHDIMNFARTVPTTSSPDIAFALRWLATEAVGAPNVAKDPQGAVHTALLPILEDHVQYEIVMDPSSPDIWSTALTSEDKLADLSRQQAAELNSHIHLGGGGGRLDATSWGAICELEDRVYWKHEFGIENADAYVRRILGRLKTPKGPPVAVQDIRLVQVRIGAACDYAQRSDGPIPFALGAFVPLPQWNKSQDLQNQKKLTLSPLELSQDSTCWLSPMLNIEGWGVGQLLVDPRRAHAGT